MNRPYVGLVAVGLLSLAAGLSFYDPNNIGLAASALRIGLVMGALWLAVPQLARPMNWWAAAPLLIALYAFFRLPMPVKLGLVFASPILLAICWPQIRAVRARFLK